MCLLSRKRQLSSTLIILVSIIAATGAVTAVSGQQTSASSPSGANLLAQLRSNDSEVRSGAFDSCDWIRLHFAIPRSRLHSSTTWIGRTKSQSTAKRRTLRTIRVGFPTLLPGLLIGTTLARCAFSRLAWIFQTNLATMRKSQFLPPATV
jgi:hypothetical protein